LIKIYYTIFHLRKTGTIKKSPLELVTKKLSYSLVILMSVLLLLSNIFRPSQDALANNNISKTIMSKIITTEFSDYSSGQLIEETVTPSSLIAANQEKYLDSSCTVEKQVGLIDETQVEDTWLTFNNESDAILKPKLITLNNTGGTGETNAKQRTSITYYTVQMGDTVSTIARKFNISINTILWANDLNNYGFIKPGNQLTILPYSGIVYTVKSGDTISKIANKYDIEVDKILSCNDFGGSLKIGQKIIVPGAKKLSEASPIATRTTKNYTGISIIKDIIKSPTVVASGKKMTWPTQGYRITQYFSWKHNGVDIANKIGTPIYAADDGVVIIAAGGYNGGYGNTIVIDHGNGKRTRYGHASKLFVKVGDEVEKGENIAAMGSTGRSTGPHLHFEVLINGSRANPLNYVK
jgi:murein DD-endopeptidase MepM/ murein hydrolase activator NlpD